MKNLTGKLTALAAALFLLLGIFVLADSASAQTKKKRTKRQTTKRTPQPVPQSTVPVVVSQADQYSDQNQQIITGNTEIQTPVETETPTQPETDNPNETVEEKLVRLNNRVRELEGSKQKAYEERQRRLLMNLDILTRAETRAESLRKQLFELIEKENAIRTKLETIEYDMRPDVIERQVAFAGSMRPEELRESRRKNLEAEKRNLTTLLSDLQTTRTNLELNVQRADQMVEKLRTVLEKDIDDALNEQTDQ